MKTEKSLLATSLTVFVCMLFSTCLSAQKSTVVIAEVLYDSPFAFPESALNKGEFVSLYNYEEDDVNIGGWRVQVTDLMKGSNTLVPVNKTLTGTVTKNQEEKASNITSSQVIAGGKTVYLAEEEVVLGRASR